LSTSENKWKSSNKSNVLTPYVSNEKVLFILNRLSGMAPYSHEFVADSKDPQMLSGFISAMGNFMGEVTGSEEVQWKTAYGKDSSMIVEGGEWALAVLVVQRETNESRSKLRQVIAEFEETFAYLRDSSSIEGGIYDDFDNYVRRIFVDSKLTNRSFLMNPSAWANEIQKACNQDITKSGIEGLNHITLEEVAKLIGMSIADTSALVAEITWQKRLQIVFIPPDNEILALSEGASRLLFSKDCPMELDSPIIMVLGALDGRRTISEIMNAVSVKNKGEVLRDIGFLINAGFVQHVSLERRLVLLNECVLSEIIESCMRELGPWKGKQYLLWAIGAVIKQNPWVSRLRLSSTNRVVLVLDDYIGPVELDEICSTMEKVTDLIEVYLARDRSKATAQRIVSDARRRCNRVWSNFMQDMAF
jgi:hypothetical protein